MGPLVRRLRDDARHLRGRLRLLTTALPPGARKIFVVGSGRSGTHWLAQAMAAHPDIHAQLEVDPVFRWATEMSMDARQEAVLFPRHVARYRSAHALVFPRHLADKSHQNLWLAERLAASLPEACFVAIRRRLEPTVASMLRHPGVRRWIDRWDRYPVPNRLLGITEGNRVAYGAMSLEERCAVRVIAHSREIDRLRGVLGGRFFNVEYEALMDGATGELAALSRLLELRSPLVVPPAVTESRDRWRSELSDAQRARIQALARRLDAEDLLAGVPPQPASASK